LQGKIPVVTMVWVVSRFRLKAPPCISSSCISPLTSLGQRSRASWASQPQKSATLSPQPGGKPRKFIRTCGGIGGTKKMKTRVLYISVVQRPTTITTAVSLLRQPRFGVFHVITSVWNVLWFYVSYFYDQEHNSCQIQCFRNSLN
jgi:hypothetical protein